MSGTVFLLLLQDGLTTGAIYALLAIAIVLVFSVTRVLFVPQGEFVVLGALTLAALQQGRIPGTIWLVLVLSAAVLFYEIVSLLRGGNRRRFFVMVAVLAFVPVVLVPLSFWMAPRQFPLLAQVVLTLALVVPVGPLVYRLAVQPIASGSILLLLFVAVSIHFILVGLALLFFGAEGFRTDSFTDGNFQLGVILVSGQSVWIAAVSIFLIFLLWVMFDRTLLGKALRATAMNRKAARLMGISATAADATAFTLAAFLGAFCGMLIGPIATIYFDSGFLIALKGFVGAVIGGMTHYPLAALGAVGVGILESFASFYAAAFKEVIVFSALIPVLLWRSLQSKFIEEEEE